MNIDKSLQVPNSWKLALMCTDQPNMNSQSKHLVGMQVCGNAFKNILCSESIRILTRALGKILAIWLKFWQLTLKKWCSLQLRNSILVLMRITAKAWSPYKIISNLLFKFASMRSAWIGLYVSHFLYVILAIFSC